MNTKQSMMGALLALALTTGCAGAPTEPATEAAPSTSAPSATESSTHYYDPSAGETIIVIVNTHPASDCNLQAEWDCYGNAGKRPGDNTLETTFNVGFEGCEAGPVSEVPKHNCAPIPDDELEAACELDGPERNGDPRWIGIVLVTDDYDLMTNEQAEVEPVYRAPSGQAVGFIPASWLTSSEGDDVPEQVMCVPI